MKKKIILAIAAVSLAAGLFGCGTAASPATSSTAATSTTTTTTQSTSAVTTTEASPISAQLTPASTAGETTPGPGTVTYSDAATAIAAGVYQVFTIALPSNPTTGYTWMEQFDDTMLCLVRQAYVGAATSGETPVAGAGGTQYYQFTPLKAGSSELKFSYARPWESSTPAQTAVFTVNATAGVTTTVSGQFTLALKSNPGSTGYSWVATADTARLSLANQYYLAPEPPEGDTPLVGAPGYEFFRFQALQAGEPALSLTYRQPWEGGGTGDTVTVPVVIR
jgi:inhibitor of cysteine peptidase